MALSLLPAKGADIVALEYKRRSIDVLWKTPWGPRLPALGPVADDSFSAWIDASPGGWQTIFPNGGAACSVGGAELGFHGEVSTAAWDIDEIEASDDGVDVALSLRLTRSPFRIARRISLGPSDPLCIVSERITNEGGEPVAYMWGHHPAFGAPFLSGSSLLECGATEVIADDLFDGPHNPATPGARTTWPNVERDGQRTDLRIVPAPGSPRHLLAYLSGFGNGWYTITNTELGFGVKVGWPSRLFPYAWLWQEMGASSGWPWYRSVYVMAVEPFSSYPSQGLAAVIEKTGSQRALPPGASEEVQIEVSFFDVAPVPNRPAR